MTTRSILIIAQMLAFVVASTQGHAQVTEKSDEQQVEIAVNRFFESLEKQDTVLLKAVVYPEGQIWRINYLNGIGSSSTRFFRDDLTAFRPDEILKETALSFDIRIHKGLAMAWVPYEFQVNGKFSHCGVDIFTLMHLDGSWRIVSVAYTLENHGCDDLQK